MVVATKGNRHLTPKDAVKAYCTQCTGKKRFDLALVKGCQGNHEKCPFFPYRLGKKPSIKIFRKYCLYCTCGDRNYISECPTIDCSVYPYRFGQNPSRSGIGIAKNLDEHTREWEEISPKSIIRDMDGPSIGLEQISARSHVLISKPEQMMVTK